MSTERTPQLCAECQEIATETRELEGLVIHLCALHASELDDDDSDETN